ncbi:MAG: hypothetical protein WD381_04090 [Balneolaceae bacterium]
MSKDPNKLRAEEKSRIVEEAISGGKENIKPTAEKYDIDVELLETWVREKDVTYVFTPDHLDDEESIDLEVTDEFARDYEYGATPDHLNYPRLIFWALFGTSVIFLMILSIFYIHDFSYESFGQQQSSESIYYDIGEMEERNQVILDSYGVVDLEAGIYRIPIDSAITQMATD